MTVIGSVPDVVGDGANHSLASSDKAVWVQLFAWASNSGPVRIGDNQISATQGLPISPGASMFLPPIPEWSNVYDGRYYLLGEIFCRAANGDKLSVIYGKEKT